MADQLAAQRDSYIQGIIALSENFRKCAEFGEHFVRVLKGASDDEMRALLNGTKRKAGSALDEDEAPKKRRRATKPKDPNAPKRPASSYILFQNEIRKELKDKHPNVTNPELLTMISDMWKKMSEEEKAQYHKAVESAKERYSQDKKAYDNRSPEEVAAANAAVAEAAAAKKSRPRKKKTIVDAAPAEVPARPPPAAETPQSASASSEEEEFSAEESDDDAPADKESQASDSSEEEAEPEPVVEEKPSKKSKKATAVTQTPKSKKGSK